MYMSILKAFCNHLFEFLDDIISLFPNDYDLKTSRKVLYQLRKFNPKSLLVNWKYYVTNPYKEQIYNENIDFFLEKDYKKDIVDVEDGQYILDVIERLRNPLQELDKDNKQKATKYILNLTKLSELY